MKKDLSHEDLDKLCQYNNYPSPHDIGQMKKQGFQYAEIYNESDGRNYPFNEDYQQMKNQT